MSDGQSPGLRAKKVFELQKEHSAQLRTGPLAGRVQRLKALKKWIEKNEYLVQKAIHKDFKKPAAEVVMSEIYPVLTELKDALHNIKKWARKTPVDSSVAYLSTVSHIQYEPKGVCLIIAPWNFPFNLTIGPLVSAIAAGNTVMLKPSEMTPHTSELIDKMVGEIFKEEEVAVFTGGIEMSQELLRLPFDHIFFTGSPAVGKIIMKAAAEHLTSVTLELGGKSPTIVDENVNVNDAAEKIAWGKFMNNGQTCVAPDYVLVHSSVKAHFIEALKAKTQKLFFNNGKSATGTGDYARIVNDKHYSRIQGLVKDAIQKGASVAFGNETDDEERFIAPTALTNVPLHADIMEEEIFGPVLPIIEYKNFDDTIDMINGKPKPLALYYFGKSKKRRKKLIRSTSSGGVCINDCVLQFGHPNLPFGGVNNSGIGKSHGKYGFLAFSNEKPVLKQRIGFTTTKMVYPPYNKGVRIILNLLKKYF